MKIADIRKLDTTELTSRSVELREEIARLRRSAHSGELQNVKIIRVKRRDLARVLTVLSEQLSKETA